MNFASLLVLLMFLSGGANALEVVGIKVPEKVQSGDQSLVLNGAGARVLVSVFNVYVIALYLPEKKHTVAEVLAEDASKRATLTFLYGVTSAQLLDATYKLIAENHSAEELKKAETGWKAFAAIFDHIKDINKDDQIALDYNPATGTRVSLNGREIGRIEAGFMRLFLKVWLGERPVQADLKDRLLGVADGKR
ncbi:MAG: lipoprotein transmembrane [Gallionellaceae bacterium]|nr:MAG: lipoprotein transmembrane [Gallionellaceae bacterium]